MHSHGTQQGIVNSHSYSTTSHCQQVITTSHIHMPSHLARTDTDNVGGTRMDDDGRAVPGIGPVLLSPFSILPLLLLCPSPPSPFPPPTTPLLYLPSSSSPTAGVGSRRGGRTGTEVAGAAMAPVRWWLRISASAGEWWWLRASAAADERAWRQASATVGERA
jgi:hypothetical protein